KSHVEGTAIKESCIYDKETDSPLSYFQFETEDHPRIFTPLAFGDSDFFVSKFISLSELYEEDTYFDPKYLAHPATYTKRELMDIPLSAHYRSKMLKDIQLSETDTLYLFNYQKDKIQKFLVSDLEARAYLNIYDWPVE